ncbi:alkyl sulfatase C-terminal domain-containing protein [Nocardia sp. IBHARD005]|uniref:alkyl sulfatase C-terminal domain-containing protein n=1 Tax=Nocardia sp. IBHARD005 TaxID=3457765 RepID=UPI004058F7F5
MRESGVQRRLGGTTDGVRQQVAVHPLRNGVLVHHDRFPGDALPAPDATITLTRRTLISTLVGGADLRQGVASGDIAIDGDVTALAKLPGLIDKPDPNFAIVTP